MVRAALKGRFAVVSRMMVADGQVTHYRADAWPIPQDRVLQFSTALRYLASGKADDVDFVEDAIDPAQVLRMAEAWALNQQLF